MHFFVRTAPEIEIEYLT